MQLNTGVHSDSNATGRRNGAKGQATDIEIEAKEILRMKDMLIGIIAENSGQPIEKVKEDCERDHFLTAQEALEYGLIDKVVTRDKK